ncbi:hypothetical protein ES708_25094 [subsurface metagenome]
MYTVIVQLRLLIATHGFVKIHHPMPRLLILILAINMVTLYLILKVLMFAFKIP